MNELLNKVIALLDSGLPREMLAEILIDVVARGVDNRHSLQRRAWLVAARAKEKHTTSQWRALLAAHGWRCAHCGTKKNITKDHVVPISAGGSDGIGNLQPLCGRCNSSKGASQ